MGYPEDLLRDAHHLAKRGSAPKSPRQSSLRRAVSTAYYAAFHLLVADFVRQWRIPDQRVRLGRMFEHRRMSGAVLMFRKKPNLTLAESNLTNLVGAFIQLQDYRNEADYDFGKEWFAVEVTRSLQLANDIFRIWPGIRNEAVAQDHLLSMFGARH